MGGVAGTTGTSGTTGAAGNGDTPTVISTNWAIQLGTSRPTCQGRMAQVWTQAAGGGPVSITGNWNCVESAQECLFIQTYEDATFQCISFTGPVTGQIAAGGVTSLVLNTGHGTVINMTGTTTATSIVGTAMFSDANVPFNGVAQ
jgi:hypothetical protein